MTKTIEGSGSAGAGDAASRVEGELLRVLVRAVVGPATGA